MQTQKFKRMFGAASNTVAELIIYEWSFESLFAIYISISQSPAVICSRQLFMCRKNLSLRHCAVKSEKENLVKSGDDAIKKSKV